MSLELGVDVPEVLFSRRHRRARHRTDTTPRNHGGQFLSRRPARPQLSMIEVEKIKGNVSNALPLIPESDSDLDEEDARSSPALQQGVVVESLDSCMNASSKSEEQSYRTTVGHDKWPSLREATCDYDFCSEASEACSWVTDTPSESSWVDVATSDSVLEPAYTIAASSWDDCGVPPETRPLSFADIIRAKEAPRAMQDGPTGIVASKVPPISGVAKGPRLPGMRKQVANESKVAQIDSSDEDNADIVNTHGWSKNHKSSWSVKSCRQVEYSKSRRDAQRRGRM